MSPSNTPATPGAAEPPSNATSRRPPKIPRPRPVPVAQSAAVAELLRALRETSGRQGSVDPEPPGLGSYGFMEHAESGPPPWSSERPDHVRLRALLDTARADPRNPLSCPNSAGRRLSVAELPDAPPQPWIADRLDSSLHDGTGDGSGIASADAESPLRQVVGPGGQRCWLFDGGDGGRGGGSHASRTPASEQPPQPPMLWFVFDGRTWVETFRLGAVFEAMTERGALPRVCVVFVDPGDKAVRWEEYSEPSTFADQLTSRYLPWAEEQFGVSFEPGRCGVAGQSISAYAALHCGVRHPEVFGRVVSQSASLWLPAPQPVAAARQRFEQVFRVEVGSEEWVLREPNRAFADELRASGVRTEFVEFAGGHDYACWRGSLPEAIAALSR
ncbi:MAG: alpha/beta hydrolase-fold protein [Leucobacter sp.]